MHKPIIIAIAAISLGSLACKHHDRPSSAEGEPPAKVEESQPEAEPQAEPEAEQAETPKEVMKDPDYGEEVTVEGKIDVIYFPNVFTMKAGIFNDELLVVAPKDMVIEALAAPEKIRVKGKVEKMVVTEAERVYSFDFDEAVEVQWEDRPFLVAESVEKLPE